MFIIRYNSPIVSNYSENGVCNYYQLPNKHLNIAEYIGTLFI